MPLPLLPVAIFGLAGTAAIVQRRRTAKELAQLTPQRMAERQAIYDMCLNDLKNSDGLRYMAKAFAAEGMDAEAKMLNLRADLQDAPPEVRKARKAVYKKAMRSKNKAAILEVAAEFENIGATSAANDLRDYASHLPTEDNATPETDVQGDSSNAG